MLNLKDEVRDIDQQITETFYNRNMKVLSRMLKESSQHFNNADINRILPLAESLTERITMRTAIIDWLKQVNSFRNSKPGVLALTIDVLDRYVYGVSCRSTGIEVTSENYQCIGSSAYQMASKIEEVSPICVDDLSKFTSHCCSVSNILEMEVIISFQLEFNVKSITPVDFIYFLTNFVDISDTSKDCLRNYSVDNYLHVISDFNIKMYPAHVIAINSIIIGYYELDDFPRPELDEIVKIFIDLIHLEKVQLSSCYDYMLNVIDTTKCNNSFDADCSAEILNDF